LACWNAIPPTRIKPKPTTSWQNRASPKES
jgi:hypothetical protein